VTTEEVWRRRRPARTRYVGQLAVGIMSGYMSDYVFERFNADAAHVMSLVEEEFARLKDRYGEDGVPEGEMSKAVADRLLGEVVEELSKEGVQAVRRVVAEREERRKREIQEIVNRGKRR
jgi:hypothetical protein